MICAVLDITCLDILLRFTINTSATKHVKSDMFGYFLRMICLVKILCQVLTIIRDIVHRVSHFIVPFYAICFFEVE